MTKLKCDALTCAYNNSNLCCVQSIQVGGKSATEKFQTSCNTFDEKRGALSNSNESPNPQMDISCKATKCIYNENKMCSANEITISGDHARTENETECATFSCQ